MKYIVSFAAAVLSLFFATARALPPLETYGGMPFIRSMAISPDGTKVAFLRTKGEQELAVVYDLKTTDYIAGLNTESVKARGVYFVSDDYVILRASETTRIYGFRGDLEYSAAFSWDYETGRVKQLLRHEDDLYPAQTGLGRIVGKLQDSDHVFMPAYMGDNKNPPYDLLKVNLANGGGRVYSHGNHDTIDWLVGEDGEVIAREEHDEKKNEYSIWLYEGGKARKIFEESVDIPRISLLGIKPDRSALVVSLINKETNRDVIVALTPDGKFSAPLFSRPDADVENIITSGNRAVYGVQYSGLVSSYEFFDTQLNKLIKSIESNFPEAAVDITDWSSDFSHLVLYVSGGAEPPAYYLFDVKKRELKRFSGAYTGLTDKDMGLVRTMFYKSRDGKQLSAILTLPPGAEMKGKRPSIIMPHGGPSSYDGVSFDWMAQYFASRGYVVVQPNFRGSSGFGAAFESDGYGEWGRGVMQHDITDAVKAAIAAGVTDPEQICIVGASYGGYAALAGGAFTPELYKCVAAIAPVADLPRMLLDEQRDRGKDSWVVAYWSTLIGDRRAERDKLEEISPANYADVFTAPVLLIHGNDDTVVPYRQSQIMERALEKAGKEVEFVKVKGGDHWLTTREMRLDTLRALDAFVSKHLEQNGALAAAH